MTGDEQVALRVTRMSLSQRAAMRRVLEANRTRRGWPIDRPDQAAVGAVERRVAVPVGIAGIGDQVPLADLRPLFTSDAWRALWRPGAQFHLYALGCTALEGIASVIGPTAKLGTAEVGGLDRRMGELRRQRYGSIVCAASGWKTQQGWEDWALFRKLQLGGDPSGLPGPGRGSEPDPHRPGRLEPGRGGSGRQRGARAVPAAAGRGR